MNPGISIFSGLFGARFAPIKREKQAGETGAHRSTLGGSKSPPQAVENRKITDVSIRPGNALFSAGSGLAKIGNSLGCSRVEMPAPPGAVRGFDCTHLSKKQEWRVRKPENPAAE